MESFLIKTFKKIKSAAPRRLRELRNLCDASIEQLSKSIETGASSTDADVYWQPFKLACESKQSKVMEASLHAMHYLIEHQYLRGAKRLESDGKSTDRRTLMDEMIKTVCDCSSEQDEGTELQVIKVLLTAVTSTHCQVHESSLLQSVKACFHIHLMSRDQNNKQTAKAVLTQMFSLVFQRMEKFDEQMKKETEAYLSHMATMATADVHTEPVDASWKNGGPGPWGDFMYPKVFIALNYSTGGNKALPFHLKYDQVGSGDPDKAEGDAFPSILHKDAFLVFRALCRLSKKSLLEENSAVGVASDPLAVRNKILSLELIYHILEIAGPAFRTGERFIDAIRQLLCVSLLENCTSNVVEVVGLSLRIFVLLVEKFKDHLKAEIEVFVTNIFLRILDSENSSLDHKMRTLQVLCLMCQDSQALVEIFINYDCDMEAIDLFREIVDALSRVAKGRNSWGMLDASSLHSKRISEEHGMQRKALEGLIHMLKSLIKAGGLEDVILDSKTSEMMTVVDDAATVVSSVTDTVTHYSEPLGSPVGNGESFEHTHLSGLVKAVGSPSNSARIREDDVQEHPPPITPSESSELLNHITSETDRTDDRSGKKAKNNFNRKQKTQEEIELGILKFNLSAKKGLAYLASKGHIEMTPKSVSKFLLQYKDKLDKTMIGDYLGKEREYENGFCVKVLHEYVDSLDFNQMSVDDALRHFLSNFRLPGEAQKIDRMMEKFAEHYCQQNKNVFPTADMAFILAFSMIMLNTDRHNPSIREEKKMTKEQFIRNNTGISTEGELSPEFLGQIFDRISASPFSLKEDDDLRNRIKHQDNFILEFGRDRRKKEAFKKERHDMLQASEALFKKRAGIANTFIRHHEYQGDEYARAMFEVAWAPVLGVLSQTLETSDDEIITRMCMDGFTLAIRIAARLSIITARDALVNSIVKFTTLDTVREMKSKNVECIKLLIAVAVDEGNYLNESWGPVLQCVSQVARLQLFANGLHTDDMFFSDRGPASPTFLEKKRSFLLKREKKHASRPSLTATDPLQKFFNPPSKAETARVVEEFNAEFLTEEIDQVKIDRIFARSVHLSSEAIQHFVTQLCEVSRCEVSNESSMTSFRGREVIADMSQPRVFSLQKLVEVADFNMTARSRITWANVWKDLSRHFSTVGVHENSALAMYAIDSLRQLSIKFLHKDELRDFNFQRLFLKPFEVIMTSTHSPEIKELILRCLDNMILARANNIRSGWKSIFAVFSTAAADESLQQSQIAFQITERLLTQHFELLLFDFVEVVNCLTAFAAGLHVKISIKSLEYLDLCAGHLASGTVAPALEKSVNVGVLSQAQGGTGVEIHEDDNVFRLWWPLLLGLSSRSADSRHEVRVRALQILHSTLHAHGALFSQQTWEVILKGILFPILDNAKTDVTPQVFSDYPWQNPNPLSANAAQRSWIVSTAPQALSLLLQLFHQFRNLLMPMLPELTRLLEGCICQEVESLARIGLRALGSLVLSLEDTMPRETWDAIVDKLCVCVLKSLTLRFGPTLLTNTHPPTSLCAIRWDSNVPEPIMQLVTRARKRAPSQPLGLPESDIASSNTLHRSSSQADAATSFGLSRVSEAVTVSQTSEVERESDVDEGPEDDVWSRQKRLAMTGWVCVLEFVKMLGDSYHTHNSVLGDRNIRQLCLCLESVYHYARCFNEDATLRAQLAQRGFMKLPQPYSHTVHLLELETQAMAQLMSVLFREYENGPRDPSDRGDATEFAGATIQRLARLVGQKYTFMNGVAEQAGQFGPVNVRADDVKYSEQEVLFAEHYVESYSHVMQVTLMGFASCRVEQFRQNLKWLLPLLSDLSVCNDLHVRKCLRIVYETQVNSLLIVGTSGAPQVSPRFKLGYASPQSDWSEQTDPDA